MSDLDLLDSSLDDLADLPEFKPFPNGAHICVMNWEEKKVNDAQAIELKLTAKSTEELADPNDTPVKAGDEASVLFMLNNEFGQGSFKKLVAPIAEHFGVSRIRDALEQSKGCEVLVVTKQRQNKDKTQTYMGVTSLAIL